MSKLNQRKLGKPDERPFIDVIYHRIVFVKHLHDIFKRLFVEIERAPTLFGSELTSKFREALMVIGRCELLSKVVLDDDLPDDLDAKMNYLLKTEMWDESYVDSGDVLTYDQVIELYYEYDAIDGAVNYCLSVVKDESFMRYSNYDRRSSIAATVYQIVEQVEAFVTSYHHSNNVDNDRIFHLCFDELSDDTLQLLSRRPTNTAVIYVIGLLCRQGYDVKDLVYQKQCNVLDAVPWSGDVVGVQQLIGWCGDSTVTSVTSDTSSETHNTPNTVKIYNNTQSNLRFSVDGLFIQDDATRYSGLDSQFINKHTTYKWTTGGGSADTGAESGAESTHEVVPKSFVITEGSTDNWQVLETLDGCNWTVVGVSTGAGTGVSTKKPSFIDGQPTLWGKYNKALLKRYVDPMINDYLKLWEQRSIYADRYVDALKNKFVLEFNKLVLESNERYVVEAAMMSLTEDVLRTVLTSDYGGYPHAKAEFQITHLIASSRRDGSIDAFNQELWTAICSEYRDYSEYNDPRREINLMFEKIIDIAVTCFAQKGYLEYNMTPKRLWIVEKIIH